MTTLRKGCEKMVWFYKLVAVILSLFIYSPAGEIATYTTLNGEAELVFTVLSDVHLEGNNEDRFELFGEGIRDINSNNANDFIVFLGDNTMNGQVVELSAFYSILDEYNTIGTFMVTGNHDLCPSDYNVGTYEDLRDRFFKYKNEYSKTQYDDSVYYSVNVFDKYQFIVLGSESDAGIQEDLSDTQLEWLENELEMAKNDDKIVFLFNHYPLNNVWADVWSEGHIGEDSDRLYELLTQYDNRTFYFSGHLHMGLYEDKREVVTDGNITFVNVPAFGADNDVGEADIQDKGMGVTVEAYENEVIIRVRNFAEHKWMDIEYEFEL